MKGNGLSKFTSENGRRCAAVGLVLVLAASAGAAELLVSSYNPTGAVSQVLRFDAVTGALIPAYDAGVAAGVFIGSTVPGGHGGLSNPRGILLGTDGNVYVASYTSNNIKKYDGTTGHYLGDFASTGAASGPWGMCWGPDGNLYVGCSTSSKVMRFQGPGGASPGAFISDFVTAGSGGLSLPKGIMFGNDQWTGPGQPAGPAQDGYPDFYVCSTNSGKILRYNGQTGAYVDIFADVQLYAGGKQPHQMIYEQFFRRNDPLYNGIYTGNLLFGTSADLQIHQGSSSDAECVIIGVPDHGFFGGFNNQAIAYNGNPVWGPNHSTDGETRQSLYLPDYWNGAIKLTAANEATLPALTANGAVSRPQGLLIKCGRNPGTIIRKVLQQRMLVGTVATLRLQGDNMVGLSPSSGGSVSIKKMRANGKADGTFSVAGQNYQMDGNDLLVDFDLTGPNVEAGHYAVQPTDSCQNAMPFPEVVLVYLPELTNGSFEQAWTTDPDEDYNVCVDPGEWGTGGGNKKRPKHWDQTWGGTGFDPDGGGYGADQFSFVRDGNIWYPSCTNGVVDGITGSHYASLHNNFTLPNYWSGMYQTIAAPDVTGQTSTKAYRVYVDAHIQSWQQVSWGSIRLIDGDNFGGALIQETVIPNTEYLGNMLVRSHDFAATVPEGYVYSSNPPVLTIEFRYYHAGSDEGPPEWGNIAGFHLDNVRNRYQQCARSPWADADEDHDVDQVDFAAFSRCLTTGGGGIQSGCECFERTDDASIDMSDFVLFQFCANGPDIPAPAHVNCD